MLSLAPATRIFVALEPVDLRQSFNGLSARVESVLAQDPLSGHLFEWTCDCTPRGRRKSPRADHTSFSPSEWQAI